MRQSHNRRIKEPKESSTRSNSCKSCLNENNRAIITGLNRVGYTVFFKCLDGNNKINNEIFSCDAKFMTIIKNKIKI